MLATAVINICIRDFGKCVASSLSGISTLIMQCVCKMPVVYVSFGELCICSEALAIVSAQTIPAASAQRVHFSSVLFSTVTSQMLLGRSLTASTSLGGSSAFELGSKAMPELSSATTYTFTPPLPPSLPFNMVIKQGQMEVYQAQCALATLLLSF